MSAVGCQVTVGIVKVRCAADAGVLVQIVGNVVGDDTVDRRADTVAHSIVLVLQVLVSDRRIGRSQDRRGQLPCGVVAIRPVSVKRVHRRPAASDVVSVVETRIHAG